MGGVGAKMDLGGPLKLKAKYLRKKKAESARKLVRSSKKRQEKRGTSWSTLNPERLGDSFFAKLSCSAAL